MTTDLHTLVLIILCGMVTLLIRVIPFVMISRVNLPAIVIKWLSFIPITLFTALIIDGVIQQHDHAFGYTLNLPYIIAIVPIWVAQSCLLHALAFIVEVGSLL